MCNVVISVLLPHRWILKHDFLEDPDISLSMILTIVLWSYHRFNRCLAYMEGGCLGYPGASTVGSLAAPRQNTTPIAGKSSQPNHEPPFQAPVNTDWISGRKIEGRVGGGMLKNTAPKGSKTAEEGRRIPLEGINTKTNPLHAPGCLIKCAETKLRRSIWACTFEVDRWPKMPAKLVAVNLLNDI